jgi:peptidoglycan hydrolase-like protein with peptidoglycan-binding domain
MGRLVRQGCKGADVRAIQDVLNFHIRRLAPLVVDGDFGPRTHARVVEFQKANQLTADGIVGPRTMGKLFEEEQLPITLA